MVSAGTVRWYLMAQAKAKGDQAHLAELQSEFGESARLLFIQNVLQHWHDMHHMPKFGGEEEQKHMLAVYA